MVTGVDTGQFSMLTCCPDYICNVDHDICSKMKYYENIQINENYFFGGFNKNIQINEN